MRYGRTFTPILFVLLIVTLRMGIGLSSSAPKNTTPVDIPVDNLLIEVSGPFVKHGIYTNFSKPLTAGELCVKLYSSSYCRDLADYGGRALRTGDKIEFPRDGGRITLGRMSGEAIVMLGTKLDPNTCALSDLEAVPGVGPKTAEKIIRYREEHGGIRDLEELRKIVGARVDVPRYFEVAGP